MTGHQCSALLIKGLLKEVEIEDPNKFQNLYKVNKYSVFREISGYYLLLQKLISRYFFTVL